MNAHELEQGDAGHGFWLRPVEVVMAGWWALFIGAQIAVLALSPSSYRRGSGRIVLRHIYRAAGPGLPGFTALMALFNLVLIRILVVTADAYGLASLALGAVVRVLVLELIPLVAAVYVAVNYAIPGAAHLRQRWERSTPAELRRREPDLLDREILPRVLGGFAAVILMAALSCVISLVLAYLAIYGFTWAGFVGYSRTVGHIFDPAVTLIFCLKTLLFAATVVLLPLSHALRAPRRAGSFEVRGLLQTFVLMLLIETASLVGNYY